MKKDTYEIGDYVMDIDGKTHRIYADDMPELPYERILRDLEPDEIPEFTHTAHNEGEVNLNLKNFFNPAKQHCPISVGAFCSFVDRYKKQVDWKSIFFGDIKFHDIPFDLQVGIIWRFFKEAGRDITTGLYGRVGDRKFMTEAIYTAFVDMEIDMRNMAVTRAGNVGVL